MDGGARKIRMASGTALPDLARALDVDLEDDVATAVELRLDERPRRAVPRAVERPGATRGARLADHPVERRLRDEPVVDARRPPRRAGPRRDRDRTATSRGIARRGAIARRSPSRPPRAGDDDQPPGETADAATSCRTSRAASRAASLPRPRTRRVAEMSSSSMIFCARTLPTPGRDSSTVDTFILPTVSSPSAAPARPRAFASRTSAHALISARFFRASAALARASARCSGVRSEGPWTRSFARGRCQEPGEYTQRRDRDTTRIPACQDLRFRAHAAAARIPRATPTGSSAAVIGRPTTR